MRKINRVGEQTRNVHGSLMTIVEYQDANNMVVEFENGYKAKASYKLFSNRSIKNPTDKIVCGVGYLGIGEYTKKTKQYSYWQNMMTRCYNKNTHNVRPNYDACEICEEWHNFQNFAKWFDENYYDVGDGDKMCLDKDILIKGNKIYSPDTCVFVPNRINVLFIRSDKVRGGYPIGVYYAEDRNKFRSICNIGKEKRNLGTFDTPEEAFYKYKEFKEQYIKEVADEYKDRIPHKLYEAMYKYEVDIND